MHYRILFLALFLITNCFAQQVESSTYGKMLKKKLPKNVPTISVNEVDPTDDTILFLDTREHEEYEVSHIENARFVGYKHKSLDSVLTLPKNTKIVVYCSIGYRSGKITKELIAEGFTDVHNLYGGIFEWSNQEMPLIDRNGNSTSNIHPYNKKWGRWITFGDKVYL